MTRLFIDVGREEGVRPGDLVGAIANEADISGRAIGAIEIFDHFSFVEVPSNVSDHVLSALKNTTIRNRRISPTLARPDSHTRSRGGGGSRARSEGKPHGGKRTGERRS
jgi:ATP-dependent RNA helicase DeaD